MVLLTAFRVARRAVEPAAVRRATRTFAVTAQVAQEAVPRFTNATQAVEFGATQVDTLEPRELQQYLNAASRQLSLNTDPAAFRDLLTSNHYRNLMQAIRRKVGTMNSEDAVRTLAASSRMVQFRGETPRELRDAASQLFGRVFKNQVELSPELIPMFISCLINLDVKELAVVGFVRDSIPRISGTLNAAQSRLMLRNMHNLQIRDRDLSAPFLATMEAQLEQYKNADVNSTLSLFATTFFFSSTVFQHCLALITNHAALFDTEELIEAYRNIVAIPNASGTNLSPITEELGRRVRQLRYRHCVRLLEALCWAQRPDISLATDVIHSLSTSKHPTTTRTRLYLVYSICRFNAQDKAEILKELGPAVVSIEPRTPDEAQMILDIAQAAKIKFELDLQIPSGVAARIDEFVDHHLQSTRFDCSTITSLLPQLQPEYHLQLSQGAQVKGYKVPLVDESNKIAILLERRDQRVKPYLKMQLLQTMGYHPALLQTRRLRSAIPDDKKLMYLENALAKPLRSAGRLSQERLEALRERHSSRM